MTAENAIEKSASNTVQVNREPAHEVNHWTYRPSVDVLDSAEELTLIADLPGATSEGIHVSLESNVLTLQAEVTSRHPDRARTLRQEYGVGNYHRRFEIDDSIDADKISADYQNGALTVHLPKVSRAQRRRIPISA